ncbi:NAD-dependent epimerase/dehydratase family protein [Thermogemmatispora tikiterensis]|uniref:Epimerase n=1 Tax=Thermogemmatispora tikiterensis TaxID=1825093 RepID=A0A328VTZ5_9CHLR|nr:NAD(P)-dependent oxidoreductase [Thermogemmatispora tikiterensis]RAQ97585.1 epimerase [Thermogemmatispora tikiterensis]
MAQERFLVTGALGCIGAWTVRNLVREGTPVVAFDLGQDTRRLKLIMAPAELAQVTFVQGDLSELAAVEQVIDQYGITHVIHLAALQMPSVRANPSLGARVNVVGTVNVFEASRRRADQVRRIVYASSVAVYDPGAGGPGGIVQHDTPLRPHSLYGVFKQANEGTARIYWQEHGLTSIGLRPATVYGPGRDQGLTSAPTRAMLAAVLGRPFHIPFGGRGEFQYADDVAKTFLACTRAPFEGAEVFNLHGAVAHMSEIVALIEELLPESRGLITFAEPAFPSPEAYSSEALSRVIGTPPQTPLHEGIAATLALFRERVARGELNERALQEGSAGS